MSVCLLLVSVALIHCCFKINVFVVRRSYIYISKTNWDCFICHDDMISYLYSFNCKELWFTERASAQRSYIFEIWPSVCSPFFKKKLSSPGTAVIQDALISGFPSKDTPALLESFWLHLPCQSIFGWKHRKIWWGYDWLAEGKSTAMFLRIECGRISLWPLAFRSSCCYFLLKAAMQVPQMWLFLERMAYLQRCQHRFLQPLIFLASNKQM